MSVQIKWTPRDSLTLWTLDLDDLSAGFNMVGFQRTTGTAAVSPGGAYIALPTDSCASYDIRIEPVDRLKNPSNDNWPFEKLSSWMSHAQAGGTFAFLRDSTKASATTLDGAIAAAATVTNVNVASTSGFAVGDLVYLEHANDKTRWEIHRIKAVSTDFDIYDQVIYDYPIASIFRHWEYFPLCVAQNIVLEERTAGRGADLWDLRFRLETVR